MIKRVVSGIIYAVLLLAIYAFKLGFGEWAYFVGGFVFDAFVTFLAIVGTFEIMRAFGDSMTKTQRVLVMIFACLVIPSCSLAEYFFGFGLHVACICFFVVVIALLSLLVFRHDETTLENVGASLFAAVYPALLLCLMVLANHIGEAPILHDYGFNKLIGNTNEAIFNANLAILLIFSISPLSDVFAFFFGITLKKVFPQKLAPRLSPNKTVVGFIGGLIGGALSSGAVYFIYNLVLAWLGLDNCLEWTWVWLPVYMAIGVLTSMVTCFGDLLESSIKRKKGLKDMGKIMPGHGGVLDRIDGTIFATVSVYVCFAIVHFFLYIFGI